MALVPEFRANFGFKDQKQASNPNPIGDESLNLLPAGSISDPLSPVKDFFSLIFKIKIYGPAPAHGRAGCGFNPQADPTMFLKQVNHNQPVI